MMRFAPLAMAFGLALSAAPWPDAQAHAQSHRPSNQSVTPAMRGLLQEFGSALQAEDFERLFEVAARIEAHAEFSALPVNVRMAILGALAQSDMEARQYDQALTRARALTDLDRADPGGWQIQAWALGTAERFDEMVAVMAEGIPHSSDFRESFELDHIGGLLAHPDVGDANAMALRRALFDYGWRRDDDDWIWRDYVTDLVRGGDDEAAARVLAEIEAPSAVLYLRGVLLYDEAVALAGDAFPDLPTALERELTATEAAATPDAAVRELHAYATALYQRGRFEEALVVADAGLARPAPTDDAGDDWSYTTWLMDMRSNILQALGRRDEAMLQQQTAAGRIEGSGRNVSNAINLGGQYYAEGRYREALQAVDGLFSEDAASPYGAMQAQSVRYCSALALEETAIAEEADAYLTEHWRDAPNARLWSLICRRDADGAAALTIQRLEDPELAPEAILDFHTYIDVPSLTDVDRERRAFYGDVLERPDVLAAFERVGRKLEPGLVTPYY